MGVKNYTVIGPTYPLASKEKDKNNVLDRFLFG